MVRKTLVTTLNQSELQNAALALNNLVFADFIPDVIIGIENGGYIVAELMARAAAHQLRLYGVAMQRATTHKQHKLKNLLRHLPYWHC